MKWMLRIAVVLLGCAPFALGAPPSAAQTSPVVTVTPHAGLVDGESVTLAGTGFEPNSTVQYCEGVLTEPFNQNDCPFTFLTTSDETGAFSVQVTAFRFITFGIGTVDCAQPSGDCGFIAGNFIGLTLFGASAPITFTPQPPSSFTVTPHTGLVDGEVVTLAGTNFARNSTVFFCETELTQRNDCVFSEGAATTDGNGAFSVTVDVFRFLRQLVPSVDCAQPSAHCGFGVTYYVEHHLPFVETAPITFVPVTLTATPHTGLVGGHTVTLAGTGFLPNAEVSYCEVALNGSGDQSRCDSAPKSVEADARGAFSVPVEVFRFINPFSGPVDCAQSSAKCGFGATSILGLPLATTPITFTPQPAATFALKGSVTGPDGHGLAGVAVWAYTSSDAWVGSLQTVTDANGDYRLDVSPTVSYAIRFGPPTGTDLIARWYNNQTRRASATPVQFPGAFNNPVITLANQQLTGGGAVSGVVTNGSGTGVPGVTVWAYGPGDTWVGSFGTTTGADGSYRIAGVRPADYKVRFMPPSTSGLAIEWYDNADATRKRQVGHRNRRLHYHWHRRPTQPQLLTERRSDRPC